MKKHQLFSRLSIMVILLLWGSVTTYAAGSVKVLGSLVDERAATIGASYDGSILIENTGKTPCQVRIYQTDYRYYADGRHIYGVLGENPASNGNWITLGANWVTVPAREKAELHYKVQIPPNQGLQGSFWSMLMIEADDDQPVNREKGKGAIALRTKIRYGVQVITNIGNTGSRRIHFLDRQIINEDGRRILQLDIENSGERGLTPVVSVQLFNKDGKLISNYQGAEFRILPTCSVRQWINLPNLPQGSYKALVIVDNGDQYVFGANYNLEIER